MPRTSEAKEPTVPVAFRVAVSDKKKLREIRKRKRHGDLSETLREAVGQYLEREQEAA